MIERLKIPENKAFEFVAACRKKGFTSLSHFDLMVVKGSCDMFDKVGAISVPKDVKTRIWAQTSDISDKDERRDKYSVLVFKEAIK